MAVLDLNPSVPAPLAGFRCDVSDDAAVVSAVAAAAAELGGIDVLVNNAGIGAQGDVTANTDDEWHRVLDVNVVGMARVTRAALPHLRASASAAVVNTCSIAAWQGLPNRALYSASKGAVYGLTLAMATDHLDDGIRVNCVCPGTADTPWVGRLLAAAADPAAERAALAARQPMGRLVTADGGRPRDRLPGEPPVRVDDGHGAGGGRRHAGPAPPPQAVTCRSHRRSVHRRPRTPRNRRTRWVDWKTGGPPGRLNGPFNRIRCPQARHEHRFRQTLRVGWKPGAGGRHPGSAEPSVLRSHCSTPATCTVAHERASSGSCAAMAS